MIEHATSRHFKNIRALLGLLLVLFVPYCAILAVFQYWNTMGKLDTLLRDPETLESVIAMLRGICSGMFFLTVISTVITIILFFIVYKLRKSLEAETMINQRQQ